MSKIIKACQIIGKYEIFNDEKDNGDSINKNKEKETNISSKQKNENKDSQQEGEKIIANAKRNAEEIIKKAKKERKKVAQIKTEAYEKGFKQGEKEGFKSGYQKGLKKAEEYGETLKTVVESFRQKIDDEVKEFEAQLIQLATEIARIVINYELDLNPELINNIVEDLLTDLGNNHQELVIKVHPAMIHYLEKEEIMRKLQIDNLEFISDNSLQKGDCVVETNFGGKEGIIEEKLELLTQKLYKEAGLHIEF